MPSCQHSYHGAVVSVHDDSVQQLILSVSTLPSGVNRETDEKSFPSFRMPKTSQKSKRLQKMLKQSSSNLQALWSNKICQAVKNLSVLPTKAVQLKAPVDPHRQIASPTQSSHNQSTESPGSRTHSGNIYITVVTVQQSDTNTCHRHIHTLNYIYPASQMCGLPSARPQALTGHQPGIMTLMGN